MTSTAKRGVFHRIGVNGAVTFELVDSSGSVQCEVTPAEAHCRTRTFQWLETLLDLIDPPQPTLHLVGTETEAAS